MVSILQRPQGVILGDCYTASIDEDYAGYATVNTTTPHGLTTGLTVFVTSFIDAYNGFWTVYRQDGFHFFLIKYDGTRAPYIQDAAITYCVQDSVHGWSCVHLPIIYKASNNRYPSNTVDTGRTVSSSADENGYTKLTLSGSLGTFEDLSWIEISGAATDALNGVHQIYDKLSTSIIITDIAYIGTNSFSGATVKLFYANYNVVINVYAGLNQGHKWASEKPYELVGTLNLRPDENNEVMFSISDYLRGFIKTVNNPLLGTLPNNLDFWTNFYIEYGESYDTSDGYTITTLESSMTVDSFEGSAANAMLEFKNQYSGYLSNYLMNRSTAKFLTLFSIPVLFGGCYQDVSFIIDRGSVQRLSSASNYDNGGYEWVTGINTPYVDIPSGTNNSDILPLEIDNMQAGKSYRFNYDLLVTGTTVGGSIAINFYDKDFSLVFTGAFLSVLTQSGNLSVHGRDGVKYIGVVVTVGVGSVNVRTLVRNLSLDLGTVWISKSWYIDDVLQLTQNEPIQNFGSGVYRLPLEADCRYDEARIYLYENTAIYSDNEVLSETLAFDTNCDCNEQSILMTWLNNLGGFDSWLFTGNKDYIVNIEETGEAPTNTFPDWGKSYGSFADTDKRRQMFRDSNEPILVRSQHVTLEQLQAIKYIKSSVLVQIVRSRYDRLTVIVDTESFTAYKDNDKLWTISFTVTPTNNIPSQRV